LFGEVHPKRLTPVRALLLHTALSSVMLAIGDFGWLVLFIGLVVCGWYFVTSTPGEFADQDHGPWRIRAEIQGPEFRKV